MEYKKVSADGGITIFLTLILSLMFALLTTVLESARYQMIRMQTEGAMDMSMNAIFAEYNKELLNQYDVFFIDTSYGKTIHAPENTGEHLRQYMNKNFKSNLSKLNADNVYLHSYITAIDENGMEFQKQAVCFIKNKFGISLIEKVTGNLDEVVKSNILNKTFDGERAEAEETIRSTDIPKKQIDETHYEEVQLNNPADEVNMMRGQGMLTMVANQINGISPKRFTVNESVSHRVLSVGNKKPEGNPSKLLFREYILDKFSNYVDEKDNRGLNYEVEYILFGHDTDVENLQETFDKLIMLRETSNIIYLLTDAAKIAEAETLAVSTATAAGVPFIAPIIKMSIIYAWGYAESVVDMKLLMSGKKVPLLKSAADWNVSLSQMSQCKDLTGNGNRGMSYKEYLRILLNLSGADSEVFRTMDMVENNIKNTKGNTYFRLDGCVCYISAEVNVRSDYGYALSIKRFFGYGYDGYAR